MFPSLRTVAATAFLILASGACAEAQYYYPAGYAGYGWNGWGADGSTVPGDIARGMGVFAAGAGYYNEQTAKANAINAETALKWNEYWYRSQQADQPPLLHQARGEEGPERQVAGGAPGPAPRQSDEIRHLSRRRPERGPG